MPGGRAFPEERFEYDADLNIRSVLAAEQLISSASNSRRGRWSAVATVNTGTTPPDG
ncbi:hypothetical protein [Scandinavium lactucae]|uniref:hypothetical protein n=1 Tax=Scandinavium lactucae TaxID=3095028 RepID=UPI0029C9C926|nr:hypothetical protein [Scandinavium sp. V105_16]